MLDGRQLSFVSAGGAQLRHEETGSTWDRATGVALLSGPLQGRRLEPHLGIVSYRQAWLNFHPASKELGE